MTVFVVKLVLSAFLLAVSAISSLAETSFMSLSRLQLGRLRRAHGDRLSFWEEDPDRVLAVLLLTNNLVNVGLGVLATSLAFDGERLWNFPFKWGGWLWPGGVGTAVIVFGEILPKVVARLHPEWIALRLASPVRILSFVLGPVIQIFVDAVGAVLERVSSSVKAERAQ